MAEELQIPQPDSSKKEKYKILIPQIQSLLEDENDMIANMANVASLIKFSFRFFWVGFYIVKDSQLVLGPYQGPPACTRIEKGKGVCGTAWNLKDSLIVPDVSKFSGHIACSPVSNSEIVIPGMSNKRVIFVLDIDSEELNSFDDIDKINLENIVNIIIQNSNF